MKTKLSISALIFLYSINTFAGTWTRVNQDTIKFEGEIEFEEFDKYMKIITDEDKTLIVNSEGGFTGAGVDIGLDMLRRDLTVIVRNECLSSCANYLFLAAKNKIIDNGYVGFHGSNKEYQEHDLDSDVNEFVEAGDDPEMISTYTTLIQNISIKEEGFFNQVGVDKNLFTVSRLDDKGSGDGNVYAFLALSLNAFEKYQIPNVSGIVNINTDPDFTSSVYLEE